MSAITVTAYPQKCTYSLSFRTVTLRCKEFVTIWINNTRHLSDWNSCVLEPDASRFCMLMASTYKFILQESASILGKYAWGFLSYCTIFCTSKATQSEWELWGLKTKLSSFVMPFPPPCWLVLLSWNSPGMQQGLQCSPCKHYDARGRSPWLYRGLFLATSGPVASDRADWSLLLWD